MKRETGRSEDNDTSEAHELTAEAVSECRGASAHHHELKGSSQRAYGLNLKRNER